MKPTVFRYGMYAMATIIVLSALHFFVLFPLLSWSGAEIAGYLVMTISMVFVFLGIRHYRDKLNQGRLRFGEGMKIGVLIVLIPAVFFGLFDLLYTEVLNPGWQDEYYGYHIEKLKAGSSPDQLQSKLDKLQKEREMFSNPAIQFLLMAGTVFIIGLIVTIISSVTLRRNNAATHA